MLWWKRSIIFENASSCKKIYLSPKEVFLLLKKWQYSFKLSWLSSMCFFFKCLKVLSHWHFLGFFTCAFIFHFLLNNLIQWSHLNTLVVNSWLFLRFFKLLYFQKFDHNCCMAHFVFQVKEGHYLSTTFMLWWKRAIIFENVAISYLDLFMKSHRKDKKYPQTIFGILYIYI